MKKIIFLSLLAFAMLGFQSCQKSEKAELSQTDLATNLTAAVTEVVSATVNEATMEDTHGATITRFEGMGPGMFGGRGFGKFLLPRVSSCATVTVSSTTFPKIITIDYGTGCADRRGMIKKGKITISITDSMVNAGATQTITYQDFYIDSMKVELNGTVKNLGKNANGNWVIECNLDQILIRANGDKRAETFKETIEWIKGYETPEHVDDSFYKTGSGSISINDTATFSRTITKPLLIDRACRFILSGTVEMNRNGNIVVLDYGDGQCDRKATVTTNGTSEEIDLFSSHFGDKGKFNKHCRGYGGNGRGWFGN